MFTYTCYFDTNTGNSCLLEKLNRHSLEMAAYRVLIIREPLRICRKLSCIRFASRPRRNRQSIRRRRYDICARTILMLPRRIAEGGVMPVMKLKFAALIALALILFTGGNAMAKAPDYQLWSASSLTKILPDQDKPNDAKSEIALYAAKGESESAQIVITTGSEPLKSVRISLDSLTGTAGTITKIELLKVEYIDLPNLNKIAPDPLPPATLFDVSANKNQPVWITISIPRNAKAGEYSGHISVKPANAAEKRMPVNITSSS